MDKKILYTGSLSLVTIILAWTVIILSIHYNPWFDIYENALSDMGYIKNPSNKIFNNGLILTGLLGLSLPVFLSLTSNSRWGQASAGVFLISVIHLTLIGIYPEGTEPHFYVSVEFFVLKWMGVLLYSIGKLLERRIGLGIIGILLFAIMALSVKLVEWPSVGLAEITSIGLFTIWIIIVIIAVFTRYIRK